jgi:hypothetical protein
LLPSPLHASSAAADSNSGFLSLEKFLIVFRCKSIYTVPEKLLNMSPTKSSNRNGMANKTTNPQRSASFHGKIVPPDQRQLRRPRTHPDLLSGRTCGSSAEKPIRDRSALVAGRGASGYADESVRKTPAKVLLNVTVQRSMWPLQVMAFAEWSVADLVAIVLRQYVKEGRRPQLASVDPSTYGLHYSQFSLERKYRFSHVSLVHACNVSTICYLLPILLSFYYYHAILTIN